METHKDKQNNSLHAEQFLGEIMHHSSSELSEISDYKVNFNHNGMFKH